ncbi:hypothetical protein Misp01_77720 [Microtetraspora sp. NBRC 13810]|uniref:hypothetical protein n=1 Tax=Microtetraspora sp. NBRC 13810 TaxID=3030990 RepID=UPI0024A2A3CC|nr:hypothetical protein [Microtetraspora sp. NBRC 13810]GLW12644.1 hypothetical protein Misp01_77720 [Microtetraspora sp. NBRC 13810]
MERLAAHRGTRSRRLVVSYLVPTRHDWVDERCADPPTAEWGSNAFYRERLWASVGTLRHLELLGWRLEESDFDAFTFGVRATMADGVGPVIAPVLVDAWDRIRIYKPWRKRFVELISLLPSDEAFKLLLERSEREFAREHLLAAMERFPVRAVRVLSTVAASDSSSALLAAGLLRMHLKAHPELPGPDPAPRIPDAPGEDLPAVLTEPGRAPRLPAYADPDALPQVLLLGGSRALPAAATRRLVALAGKPDERLDAVRDACDRRSLADLGWALFLHGDAWALPALGRLGDGRTARDLAALIPGWVARVPGPAGSRRSRPSPGSAPRRRWRCWMSWRRRARTTRSGTLRRGRARNHAGAPETRWHARTAPSPVQARSSLIAGAVVDGRMQQAVRVEDVDRAGLVQAIRQAQFGGERGERGHPFGRLPGRRA